MSVSLKYISEEMEKIAFNSNNSTMLISYIEGIIRAVQEIEKNIRYISKFMDSSNSRGQTGGLQNHSEVSELLSTICTSMETSLPSVECLLKDKNQNLHTFTNTVAECRILCNEFMELNQKAQHYSVKIDGLKWEQTELQKKGKSLNQKQHERYKRVG